jgi:excisionase family DNA binding protein
MPGESYTLREVAELLGVSKRTLQRRIKEGAFPGRFLAPGRHGLETRVPAADVQRALEDLGARHPGSYPPAPASPAQDVREEQLVPYHSGPTALTHNDLDALKDSMVALVREDRQQFLATVQDALDDRTRELSALRGQIAGLQGAVDRLRRKLESGELAMPSSRPSDLVLEPSASDRRAFDVDAVLKEIQEIEDLLDTLQGA